MKPKFIFILRIIIGIILVQTLRFKFTAHPDSVYIFTKVGLEPYGRIAIGIVELIAAMLLLINRTAWLGAGLTVGVMLGAVIMHLTNLGIDINGDGGTLFYTAVFVLIASFIVLYVERKSIPFIGQKL